MTAELNEFLRETSMRYGFIGLGHLGKHLAGSLVRGGFTVTVHDR